MQILKLVLPLSAMLMAGQALAHKTSHALPPAAGAARLAPMQTDTNPAALLGSIGGHGDQNTTATPGFVAQEPTAKGTAAVSRINRIH